MKSSNALASRKKVKLKYKEDEVITMSKEMYQCEDCEKTARKENSAGVPSCCGKPMKLVPENVCVKAPGDAEHARFDDEDEPCDDGRAG